MRSHCGVEVTEFSTNSQPYLSNTHLRCCSLWFIIISLFFNYYFEQFGRRLSPLYHFLFCTGEFARSVMRGSKPHPSYRPSLLLYFFLHRQGRAKRRIRGSKTSYKLSPHSPSHELPSCAPQVSIKTLKFCRVHIYTVKTPPHSCVREFRSCAPQTPQRANSTRAHLRLHKDSPPASKP